MAAGLVLAVLPFVAPPAFAARLASASVDRKISYRGQTYTYTFTVNNTSTAGESIASVAFARPASTTMHNVTACPQAPAGWTGTATASASCVYNSSAGSADDIAPGASQTFKVAATIVNGTSSLRTGSWGVYVDSTDTLDSTDANGVVTASASSTGALAASVYGIEVTSVVVAIATTPVGSACPAAAKRAPAGSTRVMTVCGSNSSGSSFTPRSHDSNLTGTFLQSDGNLGGGTVNSGTTNVVIANFTGAVVTGSTGTGFTVITRIENKGFESPSTTFNGYTTDVTAPPTPAAPDLDAASDSGTSSSDNITNDDTPSFSGTAEADSTVEILVDGNVALSTTASPAGGYNGTVTGALADGSRNVTVRATDASGNTSAASPALAVTVDTVAPDAITINSGPPATGADQTPTWSFSGGTPGQTTCKLDRPNAGQLVDNNCVSPKTWDLTGGVDGDYTLRVSHRDVAGNPSVETTDSFTLDVAGPSAPSITSRPPAVTSNTSPQWSFSGEPGGTFECVLVKPDTTEVTDGSCDSPKTFNVSSYPDGPYTFKVRQTDNAGNPGTFATDSFNLDRQPPGAPTIDSGPSPVSNDGSPTWTFFGESGTTYECVLVKPGNGSDSSNCSDSKTYSLTGDPEGTYTFMVRQVDGVGNKSPFASNSYTLDRQAPGAPSITSQPRNYDDDDSPEWTFEGEAGATFECVLVRPNTTEINVVSCSSPRTFDLTAESDGDYVFKVRQIDVAGNQGPYATDDYTFDRTPPKPTVSGGPVNGSSTNDPTHQFTFSGVPGAVFECTTLHPDDTEVTVDCTSPYTFDLTNGIDGDYTLSVRQFLDENGSAPVYVDLTLDRNTSPPSVQVQPGPVSNDDSPVLSFEGEDDATFECALVAPDASETVDNSCTGPKEYILDQAADGTYSLKVRQTDPAGNVSQWGTVTYRLDRQAPVVPVVTSKPTKRTADLTPAWTFTGEADATFNCQITAPDGAVTHKPDCSSPTAFVLRKVSGRYTFTVTQVDEAGNESVAKVARFTLDTTKPVAKRLKVTPKNVLSGRTKVVKVIFGRTERCSAVVLIKKARKTVKKMSARMGRKKTALVWKVAKKPPEPGKYKVLVKLTDKVGLKSKAKKVITVE